MPLHGLSLESAVAQTGWALPTLRKLLRQENSSAEGVLLATMRFRGKRGGYHAPKEGRGAQEQGVSRTKRGGCMDYHPNAAALEEVGFGTDEDHCKVADSCC